MIMEEQDGKSEVIDLLAVARKALQNKWRIAAIVFASGVLASLFIILFPRYYHSKVLLAPETESASSGGSLASIAASFGFDLSAMQSVDAIYPTLYPDLFESNDFLVGLFDIRVRTIDGSVSTDYYDYMQNYQKHTPWEPVFGWIKKQLKRKPKFERVAVEGATDSRFSSFMLSEKETAILKKIQDNITCTVDRKTDVVTITVRDQDPLICATLADSVREHLQHFITTYRTSKSRADMEFYTTLTEEARTEYDVAMNEYSIYCDAHKNAIGQSFISERQRLENEMEMKYNAYSAMNTQLQAAKIKVQESTPAFTVLQNSTVPIKASEPKRMTFVLGIMFLTGIITVLYYVKDELFSNTASDVSHPLTEQS